MKRLELKVRIEASRERINKLKPNQGVVSSDPQLEVRNVHLEVRKKKCLVSGILVAKFVQKYIAPRVDTPQLLLFCATIAQKKIEQKTNKQNKTK